MKALGNHSPERNAWEDTRPTAASAGASVRGAPHAAKRIARFDTSALSSCDEPVRRYFTHAIAHGAPLEPPHEAADDGTYQDRSLVAVHGPAGLRWIVIHLACSGPSPRAVPDGDRQL